MAKKASQTSSKTTTKAKAGDDPGLDELERPGGDIDRVCYTNDEGNYVVKVTGSGALPNYMVNGYFTKDPSSPTAPVIYGSCMSEPSGDYTIEFIIGTPPVAKYDLDIYIGQADPDRRVDANWSAVPACE